MPVAKARVYLVANTGKNRFKVGMTTAIEQRLGYLSSRGYTRVMTWVVASENHARHLEMAAHRGLMEAGYALAGEGFETFEGDAASARSVIERSMDAVLQRAKEEGFLHVIDKRLSVRLSNKRLDQVHAEAKRRDVPLSRLVEEAFALYFARLE